MTQKIDERIFKGGSVWIVDLSPRHDGDPTYYWRFQTQSQAAQFLRLIDIERVLPHVAFQIVTD